MKEHELKVWPEFFAPLKSGEKTFELRVDDRGFRAGDVLLLREWCPRKQHYSGDEIRKVVTYLLSGKWGLEPNVVCMGLNDVIDSQNIANLNLFSRFIIKPNASLWACHYRRMSFATFESGNHPNMKTVSADVAWHGDNSFESTMESMRKAMQDEIRDEVAE